MIDHADRNGRGGGRRLARATLWIGLVGAALWLWYNHASRVRLEPAERAPAAPALLLLDTAGSALSLEDLRGEVVLLNLWASWCEPCRVEIPRLNRLQREFADDGLVVLGVNFEDLSPPALAAAGQELGIAFRVVVPRSPLTGTLQPEGVLPQTWLIDREGRVRAKVVGLVPERALREACGRLVDRDGDEAG
jgi:thiol-disulfide isomerase/thioredoxin